MRFMCYYKRDALERAAAFFESIVKPLPPTWVLQPPSPRIQPPEQAFGPARLESPTAVTKSALTALAGSRGVTASTVVYAAWTLFLAEISGCDRVGFSLSLSGRMIPWPSAQDVVGPLTTRAPFSAAVPTRKTVHEWLADMHGTTLDILEFDGVMHSLPESLMQDQRPSPLAFLCLLDVPQWSTKWRFKDRQEYQFTMLWYVFQDDDGLKAEFDLQLRQAERDWAEEVKRIPGEMLTGMLNATEETLVADLLR